MKTKPFRGLAAAAVVLAVIGLVFSGVQTASTAQPQTDEIATVVARTVEAMISPTPTVSIKDMKIDIFAYQTIEAYFTGTPTPLPKPENVETAIAGTLAAMQPTATLSEEDREIAAAVNQTVAAFFPTATPTPNELAPFRQTHAALGHALTETASIAVNPAILAQTVFSQTLSALSATVDAQKAQANVSGAGQVWNYPVSAQAQAAPLPLAPEVVPIPTAVAPLPPVPPEPTASPEPPSLPDVLPQPPLPPVPETWSVNVNFDLNGGHWPASDMLYPGTLTALIGENIGSASFDYLKTVAPEMDGGTFLGWSVRFINPANGAVLYDGSGSTWNLAEPFKFDPTYPLEINCLMTAQWAAEPPPPPEVEPAPTPVQDGTWRIYVSHDLAGGEWQAGYEISPHTIIAPIYKDMPVDSFWMEMEYPPVQMNRRFRGWSLVFTDSSTGDIVFDGRGTISRMSSPIYYDPTNPVAMDCKMIANWVFPDVVAMRNTWRVHITFALDEGAHWGTPISDYTIFANIGESMAQDSLERLKDPDIFKEGVVFKGWSVRFTDPGSGNVIYDSGDDVWDLNRPFDYYPSNPIEMNCVMTPKWADPKSLIDFWSVNISYDLNGGTYDGLDIPHTIQADFGQSMWSGSLDWVKSVIPVNPPYKFRGWSVRFTDPSTGDVIYDSGEETWDLDKPFDYYPNNPIEMDCLFTAKWE